MLTYNKDIFKRILNPLGICHYFPETAGSIREKYTVPSTNQTTWEFLFPSIIRNEIGLTSYSAMNSGKVDKKNSTTSKRSEMKLHLQVKRNKYFPAMKAHLVHMLEVNAAIGLYCETTGKNLKRHELYPARLEAFMQENPEKVKEEITDLRMRLSIRLNDLKEDILSDQRIPEKLQIFVRENTEQDPITVLEILCLLALFEANDNDSEFYQNFASHYCEESSDVRKGGEESREITDTPVIGAEADSVLFRETEFQEIVELLEEKSKKALLLNGFGGCGKTSIARLIYGALKGHYDYHGWINYTGNLKQSMIAAINLDGYSDETMAGNDSDRKWKAILKMFSGTKESKLLVIDNVDYIDKVQDPRKDKELMALSGWNNVCVILTSRLSEIPGYGKGFHIDNLGNEVNPEKCVSLFYHYNSQALEYQDQNREIVHKLCDMAGYNTMVIELLAKGSRYDYYSLQDFYEKLKEIGFQYINEVPVETIHDIYNDENTAAGSLMQLFNLRTRSQTERMILWDFHCLPEAERVSRNEFKDWLGYAIREIDSLKDEGWIKYEDGMFSIHPLIRQAISCIGTDWREHWIESEEYRKNHTQQETLVSLIQKREFYKESDSFQICYRKLRFTDFLTYGGAPLEPEVLLYVANYARKCGTREIGVKFYKVAYEKLCRQVSEDGVFPDSILYLAGGKLPEEPFSLEDPLKIGESEKQIDTKFIPIAELFWKCTYYYGYMVSYTMNGYEKAIMLILQAYYILRQIESIPDNKRRLAKTLDHLGYILSNDKNCSGAWILCAEAYLKSAIRIRKEIVDDDMEESSRHLHDLAWSLDNLGNLYSMLDVERLIGGQNRSGKGDFLSGQRTGAERKEEKQAFLNGIYMLAEGITNGEIYRQAERDLREALEIREKLAEYKGYEKDTEVPWTLCNLASLLSRDDSRYEESEKLIQRALYLYEELDKIFPEWHTSSTARTYRTYAALLASWDGREDDAQKCYLKALELNQKLERDYPGTYAGEIEAIRQDMRKKVAHREVAKGKYKNI